jgi:hypothetical protein
LKTLDPAWDPFAPPVPPVEVTIVAVAIASAQELDFTFSAPVTCDGGGSTDVFVTATNQGGVYPLGTTQVSPTVVRFVFEPEVEFEGGEGWHVTAVPDCLDLHGGTMAVPVNGTL